MKPLLFIVFLLFAAVTADAQIVVRKVHGFKQSNIPGARPIEGLEKPITNNYWIYLETNKKEKITINDLWIVGKRYSVKTEGVSKTPVKKVIWTGNEFPDTVLLVPRTSNKVTLVMPVEKKKDLKDAPKNVTDMINRYDVVVGYTWNGKKYYSNLRSLVVLQSEAHQ